MNTNNQPSRKKKRSLWRLRASLFAILVFATGGMAFSYSTVVNAADGNAIQFAQAAPLPVTPGNAPIAQPTGPDACPKGECIIQNYINPAVRALSATVGVVVVISLIVAGIQYSSAGGDPSKVGAAKSRIIKTLGAFLFFIFLYVFLNYIVPGGV